MASSRQRKLLASGVHAPEFQLPRLTGGTAALPDLLSQSPILIAFFKISCPICQLTFPYLERIQQPGTLPIYGISQNDVEDTSDFNREFGVTFPTLLDNEDNNFAASDAYGISNVPTMFLIEPDGTVSRTIEGWSRKEIEWLGEKAGVQPILPGERVPDWKAG